MSRDFELGTVRPLRGVDHQSLYGANFYLLWSMYNIVVTVICHLLIMQSCLSICLLLIAIQIEEHDKDKRRAMKKVLAEHTSKSKLKEKMLVRTENGTFFFCFFFFYCFSIASLS